MLMKVILFAHKVIFIWQDLSNNFYLIIQGRAQINHVNHNQETDENHDEIQQREEF